MNSPPFVDIQDDDDDDDDQYDFINGPSPNSPTFSSDNEQEQDPPRDPPPKFTFKDPFTKILNEDMILHTEQFVKLSNVSKSHPVVEKASKEWMMTADVVVKFHSNPLYKIVMTLCPSEVSDENVQFSVCIEESYDADFEGKFVSCAVSLKFLGKDNEIILNKNINFETNGFCKHDHHYCRNELSSVSNYNFESFDTIKSLLQKTETGKLNFKAEHPYEFIPVLVDASINVSVRKKEPKISTLPIETYSVSFLSNKRKKLQEPETWTKRLRLDESFSDVVIKCGPELSHTFYAHKCTLAARSPVFKAMLSADMKEKSSGVVEIPDVSSTVMETFLALIYETDRKKIYNCDAKHTLEILKLAHRYEIIDLLQDCTSRLVEMPTIDFTIEMALIMFTSGSRFVIPDLKFKAIQCISQNKVKLRTPEGKQAIRDFMQLQYELAPALLIGLFA